MSLESAKKYLEKFGLEEDIITFDVSSATVELATQAIGCKPCEIAKSLTFSNQDRVVMVITSGDMKIDNSKFKSYFGFKPSMISPDDVERLVGHRIGGVCPFGINENVEVFLDESLKRFEYIYPACGDSNSAIKLTPNKLFDIINAEWIDVCKSREV